jgi:outer membrane murein-binding lipoprotein Lpp
MTARHLRIAGFTVLGLLLAGCAGKIATEQGQACARELRVANDELENARVKGLAGSIQWIKAANLLAAANARMQVEKFESCLDRVRRARIYIREAEK